jgi:hypothetical protein
MEAKFLIEERSDSLRLLLPIPPTRLEDVVGCLPYRGKPKTLRQMQDAIKDQVKERRGRARY